MKSEECPHCKFIEETFGDNIESNKEYWYMTEVFVYLHGGDTCIRTKNEKEGNCENKLDS